MLEKVPTYHGENTKGALLYIPRMYPCEVQL